MKLSINLRNKILSSASIVIIITTAIIALSATVFFVSQQIDMLQSRSTAVAKSLSVQLERITSLGIALEDIIGFEAQCREAVRTYPGISYAQIVRLDGLVLFDNRPQYSGTRLAHGTLQKTLHEGGHTPMQPINGDYVAMEPVHNASGRTIAKVIVAFPHQIVSHAFWQMLLQSSLTGAFVGTLGLLVLYGLLRRHVVQPITALARAVSHIREHPGDYSIRVSHQQRDDIGLLLDGFNQLLGEIEARERELIEARDAAEHANRMKSDFLAAMSHDLRTPMHAILSMNELLRNTELSDKQTRYSLNIQKAGQWLLGIINDILTFAKIESGKLELINTEFDLRQLLADTVTLQEDFARSKKLQLSWDVATDVPNRLLGDAPRLMQMLTNLVSNAIKFTESGSVHLEVMRAHQHISFSVTDTGVGIDTDKLPLLFEPFVQVANADAQRRSGTGLGLSIVKQLAEAMGGEVGVDSSLQKGATFWFTAQLRAAEPVQPSPKIPVPMY
jgi:two-component system, sensor histidine kinase